MKLLKIIAIGAVITFFFTKCGQREITYKDRIESLRKSKDFSFKTGSNSPLNDMIKSSFEGLRYFPVDESYKVNSFIELDKNCVSVRLIADTSFNDLFYPVAKLNFSIKGVQCQLTGFSKTLDNIEALFIPFFDKTSGQETYGGGRFLDVELQGNEQAVLDFNMTYNPYCAYNSNYICAAPPFSNDLEVPILAGEKLPLIDKH